MSLDKWWLMITGTSPTHFFLVFLQLWWLAAVTRSAPLNLSALVVSAVWLCSTFLDHVG